MQYNQTPPNNKELEESYLATVILHPDDDLFELTPFDFYNTHYGTIYKACFNLWSAKNPVDLPNVVNELKKNGMLDGVGGASKVSELLNSPTVINNQYATKQLRGYADLRRIIELSNGQMKRCYQAKPEDVDSIIDEMQSHALKIGTAKAESFKSIRQIIMDTVDHCEIISKERGLTGVPTGYKLLDSLLCGLQPSDLIIVAARPSMGKTALCVNSILHAAEENYPADFFSFEMADLQIGKRLLSIKSRVNSQKFRSGKFSPQDWVLISDAASRLYDLPINVDDTPFGSYQDIQRKARKSKKQNGTKAIWIDYLSFIDGDKDSKTTSKEIESITRGLKSLAKELELPVVLLCQLNRLCEQRSDKRPILSDLRDSGAIEQDADVVMFLYRDEVYNKDPNNPKRGIVEVDVAKHRNGPTGRIELAWLGQFTRIENLVKEW